MDYYRAGYSQLPVRAMGSPDGLGLGAYYATTWKQGIQPDPGGANTIAQYHAIAPSATSGLGCGCSASAPATAAAGLGDLSSMLSSTWVKVGVGVALLGAAYMLFGRKAMARNGRRRHRRNAKWSGKYKRSLPDDAFLYVAPGGHSTIEGGKRVTVPRNLRHFPYKNAAGNIDLAHLRNAIARIPQSNHISQTQKTALQAKARALLAEHGGYARARKAGSKGVLRAAA
jgi:hypothetical protein